MRTRIAVFAAIMMGLSVALSNQTCLARDLFAAAREKMVEQEIVAAGVKKPRVIDSMRATPRHEFVPLKLRKYAYFDMALPIGARQTISPPFVVAYMTEQIDPQPRDRVLEIGTGSGYQAAVLSPLVQDVYTIEIVTSLGETAARTLARLQYDNVHTRIGDGYKGWPSAAPFDKIIVTCSPESVPQPLVEQLREGGLMIVPVGERYSQNLYLFTKRDGKLESQSLRATLFVPMTGHAEESRQVLPDPLNPTLVNGDFEQVQGEEAFAAGWHYQRQMEVVDGNDVPQGKRYARFSNADSGRGCRALQGFAVDGRKIAQLQIDFSVRGSNIRSGQDRTQFPYVVITFYDERRAQIRHEKIGPFTGTFDWMPKNATVRVPLAAREAIFRIGLLGATGEISYDDIQIAAKSP